VPDGTVSRALLFGADPGGIGQKNSACLYADLHDVPPSKNNIAMISRINTSSKSNIIKEHIEKIDLFTIGINSGMKTGHALA
jgi:hypothetical protein